MMLAADIPLANIVLIAGLLLVSGILLWRSNRYFARQARGGPLSAAFQTRKPDEPASRPLPPAADSWEVEMHEVARDLLGRIDSKLGLLQQYTIEADRAAARLERALSANRQGGTTSAPAPQTPPAPATTTSGDANAQRRVTSRHDEIYTLSDYGYPPEEIAQRTGTPLGEVELILSLRGRRA